MMEIAENSEDPENAEGGGTYSGVDVSQLYRLSELGALRFFGS